MLVSGGEVFVQLIQALGAAFTSPDGGSTSHAADMEGITQKDPLSMVLYTITLISLTEELRLENPGIHSRFHADNVTFDGFSRIIAHLLRILLDRGLNWVYFTAPTTSPFIADSME